MTLLDTIKDLARGCVLRCRGSLPYEAIVDLMVVEFPMGGERTYALMVVSGYKAGLLYVVLPSESRPANGEGCAIDANWLRNHWATWGYPDCQLSEVQLIEPYISYVSESQVQHVMALRVLHRLSPCPHGLWTAAYAVVNGLSLLLSIAPLSNAYPASGTSRQVLESLPADIGADGRRRLTYELALVPCDDAACPFEVRLVARTSEAEPAEGHANKGVDTYGPVRLTWYAAGAPASGADAQTHNAEPIAFFGAALPRTWTTGLEEDQVAVSAGVVPIEPGKQTGAYALLVTQTAGFEHLKRQHVLLTAVSGDLKVAWSKAEPQGPHVSWVAIPKGHAPVYVSLFFSPDGGAADDVLARRLTWDARQQVFSEEPSPLVQAVVAGSYRTLGAAREARSASDCLTGYSAIDTGLNRRALPHRYALIRVTWEPAQVAAETERLRLCHPGGPAHSLSLAHLLSPLSSHP